MFTLLYSLMDRMDRFGHWFDRRFGWFFTNGMKDQGTAGKAAKA
jgi:hypothetical protein